MGLNELVARVPHLNGWLVQELPPSREKSARTRRDKIPGDLSCQELASLGSVPIPDVWACMELAMPDLDPPPAHHAATWPPGATSIIVSTGMALQNFPRGLG